MRVRVTVLTPKNQAERCVKTQRRALLGYSKDYVVLEEKVVSDHEFFWVVEVDSPSGYAKILEKATRGEVLIRKFYRSLFKLIDRGNKLANKFGKGLGWVRKWIVRKIRKSAEGDLVEQIEGMSDDEFKDFLKVTDRADLELLFEKKLISVERLE